MLGKALECLLVHKRGCEYMGISSCDCERWDLFVIIVTIDLFVITKVGLLSPNSGCLKIRYLV